MTGHRLRLSRVPGIASVIVALAAVVLPNPPAKLCIAPGGHIAVEEICADCCGHPVALEPAEPASKGSWDASGECGGCTDIAIAMFGPATIRASQSAAGAPAEEILMFLSPADISESTLAQESACDKAFKTAPPSVPLRC